MFAAAGTLARQLINGARQVRVFGEEIQLAAHIHTISGFSTHADRDELLAWHARSGSRSQTFLIHGEEEARATWVTLLRKHGYTVELPALYSAYTV